MNTKSKKKLFFYHVMNGYGFWNPISEVRTTSYFYTFHKQKYECVTFYWHLLFAQYAALYWLSRLFCPTLQKKNRLYPTFKFPTHYSPPLNKHKSKFLHSVSVSHNKQLNDLFMYSQKELLQYSLLGNKIFLFYVVQCSLKVVGGWGMFMDQRRLLINKH